MTTQTALPSRAEIAREHTYDVESIFASPAAFDETAAALQADFERAAAFEGRLSEGPETLEEWMTLAQEILRQTRTLMLYATLVYSVDAADEEAAARLGRARTLWSRGAAATAFAEPELMAIGLDALDAWIEERPSLALYRPYFSMIEDRRAHVRSPEVEALLSELMDPFSTASSIHGVMTNTDLQFAPTHSTDDSGADDGPLDGPLDVAQSTIRKLLTHSDRTVRRSAYESYADAHLDYQTTMAACLTTGVKQDVFTMRARRYDSSLEAALAPGNIPTIVFHNLIDVFKRNLPTWHRYWDLRRRALGLEKMSEYDIWAPLTQQSPVVPYAQSVEWIAAGMAPLGDDYVSTMRRGVEEERWVDIYPNRGKRAGAFSYGAPGTRPFIFMSYTDDLLSLSTLAHELGHSMHSYNSYRHQPTITARYTMFAAEVASNFNQALVRDYLLRERDERNFQIALIEEAMSNFHRYFFVMPTLARFELAIHEQVERGESLTGDGLTQQMADLFTEGYGDAVACTEEMDRKRIGITWAEFSTHLYSNFYVFQYATGISAAHALAKRILDGTPGAADAYLDFLRAGGTYYPIDALRSAGVDMTTPQPVEETFAVLAGYVDRLEALLEMN